MTRTRKGMLSVFAAGSTAAALLVGCCNSGNGSRRESCNDVAPGSLPDPCGTSVHNLSAVQRRNAEYVSYAIFTNEWFMGRQALGPYGEYHVQQIARLLPTSSHDVMIQPSMDPALNEARRVVVVTHLLKAGILDAEARVHLEYVDANQIYGEEAPRIFNSMIQTNQSATQSGGAGTYFPGNVSGNAAGVGSTGGIGGAGAIGIR